MPLLIPTARHFLFVVSAALSILLFANSRASADVGWHCDEKKAVKHEGDEFPSLFSLDGGETFEGHLYSFFKVRPGPGIISENDPPLPTLVHDIRVMPLPGSGTCELQWVGKLPTGQDTGAKLDFDPSDNPAHMKVTVTRNVNIPGNDGLFHTARRSDDVECSFTGKFKDMVKNCAVPASAQIQNLMTCTSDAAVGPPSDDGPKGSTFSLDVRANESVGQAGVQVTFVELDGTRINRGGREMKVTASDHGGNCVLSFSEKDKENSMSFQMNKTLADDSSGGFNLTNFKATTYVRDDGLHDWKPVYSHYRCTATAALSAHMTNCQFKFENGSPGDSGSDDDGTRRR